MWWLLLGGKLQILSILWCSNQCGKSPGSSAWASVHEVKGGLKEGLLLEIPGPPADPLGKGWGRLYEPAAGIVIIGLQIFGYSMTSSWRQSVACGQRGVEGLFLAGWERLRAEPGWERLGVERYFSRATEKNLFQGEESL